MKDNIKALSLKLCICFLNSIGIGRQLHSKAPYRWHLVALLQDSFIHLHFEILHYLFIDRPAVLKINHTHSVPSSAPGALNSKEPH